MPIFIDIVMAVPRFGSRVVLLYFERPLMAQVAGGGIRTRLGFAEAHNNYGVFLEKHGELVAAEQHYLEALQQRPDYVDAHYNYAMFLERVDRSRAEEHYSSAIRSKPDYAEAHNNLAVLLHENGDLAGAENYYRNALKLRPEDPELQPRGAFEGERTR
ncbi:tetratricopeptide repeat protein [Rhizobium sp. BK376]|uniref:tetratricopeptide repeat protein n=1 Tax=Rhizobium sp. BK376 TaxID=2512149 RepID=UPI001FDFE026|nr:tetratricopeptide repeat protein [Rhizobium sp. BK376]